MYLRLTELLQARGWTIVCGSPPAGTDARFRKCLLPRRDLGGGEKGPRDEVDVTAFESRVLVLAECKSRLSESLEVPNLLGETDYEKLTRILRDHDHVRLASLLQRGTGIYVPNNLVALPILVVGQADVLPPTDMSVLEIRRGGTRLLPKSDLMTGLVD